MPLVEIEIIGEMTVPEPGLPSILADELGLLFGSAPGGTWVRLRKLPKSPTTRKMGLFTLSGPTRFS